MLDKSDKEFIKKVISEAFENFANQIIGAINKRLEKSSSTEIDCKPAQTKVC